MPNHCANDFRVHGNPRLIKEFIAYARQSKTTRNPFTGKKSSEVEIISCDKFVPYPGRFKDLDEKRGLAAAKMMRLPRKKRDFSELPPDGFNSGGYEWRIDNWGTKWGVYDCGDWKVFKRSAFIRFFSAWSPPLPVIRAIARKFPKLRFTLRYYERGAAYKGVLQLKGDVVLQDSTSEYHGQRGG